jgi:transcriptional antiterminator NusG
MDDTNNNQNDEQVTEVAVVPTDESTTVVDTPETDQPVEETVEATEETPTEETPVAAEDEAKEETDTAESQEDEEETEEAIEENTSANDNPNARWYVVHTFSGHENRVATNLKQRIDSEHLENKIIDILVPTQDKIEIRSGKKEQVKEKIFPGYILVKMELDDLAWLAVRTTQGVTGFVGMSNKPTPIPDREVQSIVKFMTQGAAPTFKDVFMVDDTVRIIDGPFADFIGKVDSVDKEKGKVRVLVSIFGRETPVELDFLQVTKL